MGGGGGVIVLPLLLLLSCVDNLAESKHDKSNNTYYVEASLITKEQYNLFYDSYKNYINKSFNINKDLRLILNVVRNGA
jgi:hypothetical protein